MYLSRPARLIFIATLMAGTVATVLTTGWAVWRGQPRSVFGILRYGGFVRYDYEYSDDDASPNHQPRAEPGGPNWLRHLRDSVLHDVVEVSLVYGITDDGQRINCQRGTDDVLVYMEGLPQVRVLLLQKTQATDAGLAHIENLLQLEALFMWDAELLTDDGLDHLRGHSGLRNLYIGNSRVTDAGLEQLSSLKRLEFLTLQGHHFSDNGLKHLSGLKNLKQLWVGIGADNITDAGLEHLTGMSNLEVLDIQGSQVTDAGLTLLKPLPKLREIVFGSSPITEAGLREIGFMQKHKGFGVKLVEQPSLVRAVGEP